MPEVDELTEIVATLSPDERVAVRAFVDHLRGISEPAVTTSSPFVAAAQHFIRDHPELLRRLAQ